MHRVATLAIDGVAAFELAIPAQILGAARRPGRDDEPLYDVRVCGATAVVATAGGEEIYRVRPPHRLAAALECETIIVPASARAGSQPTAVLDLLRTAHDRGVRIASICTGAFVLAAAGLLDGRSVTTHWAYADELAAAFPAIDVDPSVLFIDDGDILTSAGVASGMDLCLHLIRRDHGAEAAATAARRTVMPPNREGGQTQYVRYDETTTTGDSLASVLAWMQAHLHEPLRLDDIAAHANISTRTLVRRFPEGTGVSPLQWLLRERVRRAQRLLESTRASIEEIAGQTGFRDAARLRRHFVRVVGVTPQAYRRSFRAGER